MNSIGFIDNSYGINRIVIKLVGDISTDKAYFNFILTHRVFIILYSFNPTQPFKKKEKIYNRLFL